MTEKPNRPRTFKGALNAWPEAMKAVQASATSETLNSLCTLLDVMDGEIVRCWESDGHAWRLGVLRECRAAARQANEYVAAAGLAAAKARGEAAAAAKRAKADAA